VGHVHTGRPIFNYRQPDERETRASAPSRLRADATNESGARRASPLPRSRPAFVCHGSSDPFDNKGPSKAKRSPQMWRPSIDPYQERRQNIGRFT
jgi:hypothetical protein